jgi:two-component system, NtrC family, nitrogen regulation sensor histidine kinase NtrY
MTDTSPSASALKVQEQRRTSRFGRAIRLLAFLLALVSIMAMLSVVMGFVSLQLTPRESAWALGTMAGVGIMLLLVISYDLWRLLRQRWSGEAGARLHLRIVSLFTLIAAVPAILLAIVASLTLERGLTPWFSGSLRELVTNSDTIAQGYQQQLCQNVGREMRLMAEDLDHAKRTGLYDQSRGTFQNFLTTRAVMLGFPFAAIISAEGTVLERAQTRSPEEPLPPRDQDFREAATPEPPCMLSNRHVGALIKLSAFENQFLYVARVVDQRAITFGRVAEQAVDQYRGLDQQRVNVQQTFIVMYGVITLMLVLSAMWLGLTFADRLVEPVRRLITATDAAAAGNLYVQVPAQASEGDIGHLGRTFNNMVAEIRQQQNRLMSASEALDRRRQFTEAVLGGVSVGVMGARDDGRITIANPVAERVLGQVLVGQHLADVAPPIGDLVSEARLSRTGSIQKQIEFRAGARDMTLFVRVTTDQSAEEARSFVITFDDITDLVTAQRTSAWADVARRIAHEIKNPLTPIQLSAERIRRKYGKQIVEDRTVFDQCTDTIIRQVDDIRRMVDEFSSFARMPKPTLASEDIVDVLRQTLFMMRIAHGSLQFEDNLPEGVVKARFDRRLVGQAVQNILKNATEGIAARQGDDQPQGVVTLGLYADGPDRLVIDVADNGIGFPNENRNRLLEPYMTTRDNGTGLGLAIVAKIFEDHGGGIDLLDRPNSQRGALVRMTLLRSMSPAPDVNETPPVEDKVKAPSA